MRWPNDTTAGASTTHYLHAQSRDVVWPADMLAQIPDDVLVEECRRRGLEVRR